jgi:hypothetical protein
LNLSIWFQVAHTARQSTILNWARLAKEPLRGFCVVPAGKSIVPCEKRWGPKGASEKIKTFVKHGYFWAPNTAAVTVISKDTKPVSLFALFAGFTIQAIESVASPGARQENRRKNWTDRMM